MAKPGDVLNPAGKPPGTKDRATVLRPLLDLVIEVADPEKKGATKKVTLYEAAALGQIQSAMKGNTNAWKEIQDSLHGKMADKTELSNPDGSGLLDPLLNALEKAYGDRKG